MIFKAEVEALVERFIGDALKAYPNTLQAILSHPRLPEWYATLADELTRLKAIAASQGEDLDLVKAVNLWAAKFVEHTINESTHPHKKTVQNTLAKEDMQ
jgi:hypothetical protein